MNQEKRSYRWLPFITALFVTTLIISNIIAVKLVNLGGLFVPAAVILFPIAYLFGDVLTEVYGYARARQVIWTGFFCNLVAVIAIWIGGLLPSAPFWSPGNFYHASDRATGLSSDSRIYATLVAGLVCRIFDRRIS